MATLLSLPNEILLLVVAHLDALSDVAAAALTSCRLCSIANPHLYVAAARHRQSAGRALFYSVDKGFVLSVRRLLSHGVDPNLISISSVPLDPVDQGFSRSWPAATFFYRHHSDLTALLRVDSDFDSDPNNAVSSNEAYPGLALRRRWREDHFHWTALHIAAACGHDGLIALLLDAGAAIDPLMRCWNRREMMGAVECVVAYRFGQLRFPQTPLGAAISMRQHSAAELLLSRSASILVSNDGITALHAAAWYGDLDLCRSLVDKTPQLLQERTRHGLTPLHYAAASGHLEPIGVLLRERGADIRATFPDNSDLLRAPGLDPQCDSFTQALRRRCYSTASALLDLDPGFATPGDPCHTHHLETCLGGPNPTKDDKSLFPVFQRLFRAQGQLSQKRFNWLLITASALHLPQTVALLLEAAKDRPLSSRVVDTVLSNAFCHVRSSQATETVMALVNYSTTALGRLSPGLASVFAGGLHVRDLTYHQSPSDHNLAFTEPGVLEAVLELAKWIHDRLKAGPGGVSPQDLRLALPGACQPGGLKACEWLCSLGALDCIDEHGFLYMLSGTALPPSSGGNDPRLAEWVVTQADKMGHKDWVLARCDVPHMIVRSNGCAAASVAVRAGAGLTSPRRGAGRTRRAKNSLPYWRCHKLRRLADGRFTSKPAKHVVHTVCARPELDSAEELLRLAVEKIVATKDPRRVINCALSLPLWRNRIFTPASAVCTPAATGGGRQDGGAPEPTRLALLTILLAAGAEVHATIEYTRKELESEAEDIEEHGQPESLWTALAWKQGLWKEGRNTTPPDPPSLIWRDDPVRSAIKSGMPTLVRAMLEARPLLEKNTSNAVLYLLAACGGRADPGYGEDRLSPQVLDVVLSMANLTHPDVPLGSNCEPALRILLLFFAEREFEDSAVHQCRCGADLLKSEASHLTQMIAMLLGRGASWTARSSITDLSALVALKALLKADGRRKSVYKQHNIAELRKHIVLDLDSEASYTCPNFNPFEMGDIKATTGMD
ncbi:ankyrin repeat and KH domain-containing protein mask [Staphylotrichum tortipilum]|uniref:Ankyrin repeat and KH domain-containing protein mask n=1 Tax=Staphylotrichum tortipilum TaxID=2831512 RepID=A0AAN6RQX1_9PEZI|nr:ankyrin repeat and KH domain-containing protein mask [Staphylotrichum longicolle]